MINIKLSLLGSTGSIGKQALEVARRLGNIDIVAISGNKNIALLEKQIRKYKPKLCAIADESYARELKIKTADINTRIAVGQEGVIEAATHEEADTVLCAIVGFAALTPLLQAIRAKKTIALANKEALVVAGDLIMKEAADNGVKIIPVDSEHSAISQCIGEKKYVTKIILTASGGPFYGKTKSQLEDVTPAQALAHPKWVMGNKISVDSATLMNKGFEIIESKWLFGIDDIQVVIHRESIIHSMVEYNDKTVMAHMAPLSMKLPLQYAFTYPKRQPNTLKPLDFTAIKRLSFDCPDRNVFRCLGLAQQAMKMGGGMTVVVNAANEIAVDKFLKEQIRFLDIPNFIEQRMAKHVNVPRLSIDDIIELDKEVRRSSL